MLSREFSIDLTLLYWDYILGGVFLQHTSSNQKKFAFPLKESLSRLQDAFPSKESDPFINLDIMCVSMIVTIKNELLESDFSMCLANMLSYQTPEDPGLLIIQAIDIKKRFFTNQFVLEELKQDSDGDDKVKDHTALDRDSTRRNA